MVVRCSRPDVSLVVAKVHPQPPSGEIERVAARGRYIVRRDAVPLQFTQVRAHKSRVAPERGVTSLLRSDASLRQFPF